MLDYSPINPGSGTGNDYWESFIGIDGQTMIRTKNTQGIQAHLPTVPDLRMFLARIFAGTRSLAGWFFGDTTGSGELYASGVQQDNNTLEVTCTDAYTDSNNNITHSRTTDAIGLHELVEDASDGWREDVMINRRNYSLTDQAADRATFKRQRADEIIRGVAEYSTGDEFYEEHTFRLWQLGTTGKGRLFAIDDNGAIQTNQADGIAPTGAPVAYLPIYNETGMLLGKITIIAP